MKELTYFIRDSYGRTHCYIEGEPNVQILIRINEKDVRLRKLSYAEGVCKITVKGEISSIDITYINDIEFNATKVKPS